MPKPRTETEKIAFQQQNLHLLHRQYGLEGLLDLANTLPLVVHFNRPDLSIHYLNPHGCAMVNKPSYAVAEAGVEFLKEHLHPLTLAHTLPRFVRFYQAGDATKICYGIELVKDAHHKWQRLLTFTAINENGFSVVSSPTDRLDTGLMAQHIQDDAFVRKHFHELESLSAREIEILILLCKGYSSSEIAAQLYLSAHTVNTHRRNILKKTGCKRSSQLYAFASHFGLLL